MDLQGPRGQPPPSPHRRMKRTGISASSLPPGLTVASPDASPSSALTSRTTPSHSQIQLYSCLQCKHRKVKCDRIDPCGNCEKAGAECVYRTPPPPKRKKRKHQQGTPSRKGLPRGMRTRKPHCMLSTAPASANTSSWRRFGNMRAC